MVIPLLEKQFFFESCVVSKIFLSFKITAAISFLKSVIFHFSYRSISLILSFHSLLKMNNPYQIIPSFSNFFFFLIFLLNLIENFLFFFSFFLNLYCSSILATSTFPMSSISSLKASLSSSFSSSSPRWKYDVFLSFRGEDTRTNFTDHLYVALKQKGIVTFRDEENLERGKSISPELLKAIKESRFAIVILSRNFASSTWCLDELTKIIECMKEMTKTVLPIFYDVDPSNVRKQTGTFVQAFFEHEERFKDDIEKVHTWRAALREVANLKGWHLLDR